MNEEIHKRGVQQPHQDVVLGLNHSKLILSKMPQSDNRNFEASFGEGN